MKLDALEQLVFRLDELLTVLDEDEHFDELNFPWVRVGVADPAGRRVDVTLDASRNITVNPQR